MPSKSPRAIANTKFAAQRIAAIKRGIEFLLTFDEWYNWWLSTGHWHERGRRSHEYCMARKGDIGPYALDNIECVTNEINCKQNSTGENNPFYGKKHDAKTSQKMSQSRLGNKNSKVRPIKINGVRYPTIVAAAKQLNLTPGCIRKRALTNYKGYEFA